MTTQWGAPLTGAQMKLLRAAGLGVSDNTQGLSWGGVWLEHPIGDTPHIPDDGDFRLPADHPAYTLLKAGWLDIPNVRLHDGSDKAPDGWDGGKVLLSSGEVCSRPYRWTRRGWKGDIIAYIAKDDVVDMRTERMERQRQEQAATLANEPEIVTIPKMTEAEAIQLFNITAHEKRRSDFSKGKFAILLELGLIKPEPTREDRFWQAQQNGGAHVDANAKAWVRDALNFERD